MKNIVKDYAKKIVLLQSVICTNCKDFLNCKHVQPKIDIISLLDDSDDLLSKIICRIIFKEAYIINAEQYNDKKDFNSKTQIVKDLEMYDKLLEFFKNNNDEVK